MNYVGIDEVGRGAFAGPLVVGAVLVAAIDEVGIRQELEILLGKTLQDSKKHSLKEREQVATYIRANLTWGLGEVAASDVDRFGLTRATTQAADMAIAKLIREDCHLQIDAGIRVTVEAELPFTRHPKADEKLLSVCLASHLAKAYRDNLMRDLSSKHPQYAWQDNVGYGTKTHRDAIRQYGATPEHRQTFLRTTLNLA